MTSPACSDAGVPTDCLSSAPRARAAVARRLPALLAALLACWSAVPALAFTPFVVRDIRVEGVQRTEAGTVFSYLPVKVGDRIDDEKAAQAVKALYATGFFRDVRLEVQDGVLIVLVQERPTISKVEFSGNKEFDTETLKKTLTEFATAYTELSKLIVTDTKYDATAKKAGALQGDSCLLYTSPSPRD